jgi:hypothetical protein
MDLWVERRIITTTLHVFSLKLLCKKDMYSVNHCVNTIKEFEIFFPVAFFSKFMYCDIKPSVAFNLLPLFNVYWSIRVLYFPNILQNFLSALQITLIYIYQHLIIFISNHVFQGVIFQFSWPWKCDFNTNK